MRTGNREMTISLGKVLARHSIRPIVDKVFAFEEAKSAWVYQRTQKHFGKVVIRFDIGEHGH
jgi:NADPH:quinone reductase-like Zn-dependent oxidoreductase